MRSDKHFEFGSRCGRGWRSLIISMTLFLITFGFLGCSDEDNPAVSDTKAPVIVSTTPESCSQGISISAPIQVEFSEDMDSASLGPNSIRINGSITGSINYENRIATFAPSQNLDWETEYAVTVSGECRDLAANSMGADYNWHFVTESAPPGVVWDMVSNGMLADWTAVTNYGRRCVAVGGNSIYGPALIASEDGRIWQPTYIEVSFTAGISFKNIAVNGSIWVAVGDNGIIATSLDGYYWTLRSEGIYESLNGIIWSGGFFVAVGRKGTVLTSPDGVVWTEQASGSDNPLLDVCWSGSLFVAAGWNGVVLTSPDAITWTEYTIGQTFYSLIWVNDKFYAVGSGIFTSTDGENWVKILDAGARDLNDIYWSGERFVAVGDGVFYSEDGQNWSLAKNGGGIGVTGNNSFLVAVGGNGGGFILISE